MNNKIICGLQILSFLVEQSCPVSAKQVLEATGVPRASVYRTLQELTEAGWVVESGSPKRFAPSLLVVYVGLARLRHLEVRDRLLPVLIDLAKETARPCNLGFYEDGHVVFSDQATAVGGSLSLKIAGRRVPAASTASGKILLAYQAESEIDRVVRRGLPNITAHTITDPEKIAEDIRLTRKRGYALADREYNETARGLAVPVFGPHNMIAAALGVKATGEVDKDFVSDVLRIATMFGIRASEDLGHFEPPRLS